MRRMEAPIVHLYLTVTVNFDLPNKSNQDQKSDKFLLSFDLSRHNFIAKAEAQKTWPDYRNWQSRLHQPYPYAIVQIGTQYESKNRKSLNFI